MGKLGSSPAHFYESLIGSNSGSAVLENATHGFVFDISFSQAVHVNINFSLINIQKHRKLPGDLKEKVTYNGRYNHEPESSLIAFVFSL